MGVIWRLIIALTTALCLVSVSSNPASAVSPQDYFSFSYDVQLSKSRVQGSELFEATIKATGNCTNTLPLPFSVASEAEITGRIIARHQASGANVTLNSSYTLTIDPFPGQEGETTQVQLVVPLHFPSWSQPGTYSVIAELTEASVSGISVTVLLPSSQTVQTVGSITYVAPDVVGGGGGGGGGGGTATTKVNISGVSATTSLMVNSSGVVQETCQLKTLDERASLDIVKGTKLLDSRGNALASLSGSEVGTPPAPPPGTAIVSAVDFGPDGATFEPVITLTMDYDPESLPDGMTEDELYIIYWDSSRWQTLPSVLDTEANTVSAQISHFTQFAIAGKLPTAQASTTTPSLTPSPPVPAVEPPSFTISALSITPDEVKAAQKVTVSAIVTNTGGSRGGYTIILKVNGIEESRKQLIFDAGAGQKVSFDIVKNLTGTYEVDVNELVGSFIVTEATEPAKSFNWWLIGGIIAGIVLLGLVSFFIARKRG